MSERTEAPARTMEGETLVRLEGVTKRYTMFGRRRDRMLAFAGRLRGMPHKTAVEDVSLSVGQGEAFGIIGENGSGKSTLLRLVAGISTPDAGRIMAARPVAAILELGLGFHPEFTGRENALLYGSLIGVPEEVMRDRLDEVLAFAELGEFIDQPLRTYSSGMAARLGFAVATNVDPRVLVVDEALAVGDSAFQKKCIDRMLRFKEEGRAVLFCSHAMYLVTSFCQRAVWLHRGRVAASGPAKEVVEAYESYLLHRDRGPVGGSAATARAAGAPFGGARVTAIEVLGAAGSNNGAHEAGEPMTVRLHIAAAGPDLRLHVGVTIDTVDGHCVYASATHWDGLPPLSGRDSYAIDLRVATWPVLARSLVVTGFVLDDSGLQFHDQAIQAVEVRVAGKRWSPSLLELPHDWVRR